MERAADCRQRAEQTMDPALKADLLDMETRWADLARNYEFVESLERFVLSARQHRETRIIKNDSIAANQNGHGQLDAAAAAKRCACTASSRIPPSRARPCAPTCASAARGCRSRRRLGVETAP